MVEDCRRLADLVAEGLSDEGIATDVAYDGTAAASKLDHNAYDVVVLDRALPGVHGDALCQKIARAEGRSMVLMLSARIVRRCVAALSSFQPRRPPYWRR